MKRVVLDASVALGAFLPDENHQGAVAVFAAASGLEFHVPEIWKVEIGNAFLMAVRRERIPASMLELVLESLGKLAVQTDPHTGRLAWSQTMALAQKHRLTLYDAAYLELAVRREAALATLDARLGSAALKEGLELAV